jgi:hypothetical protein
MRRIIQGLVALLSTAVVLAAPASAHARQCGNVIFAPQSEEGAFSISAHGTSCQVARQVAAQSRPRSDSRGSPSYSALSYRCRGASGQLGGMGKYVVTFTCARGHSTVSFLRG